MSVNCMDQLEKAVYFSCWENDYHLYHLRNACGTQVDISDLGATIVHFLVHDEQGTRRNIVLGYDRPGDYLEGEFFIGGVVGPWANRIAGGSYSLNESRVALDKNEGDNHLHGGSCQLHKRKWQLMNIEAGTVSLRTCVRRGDGGYPVDIDIHVTYRLTDDNELYIDYYACPEQLCPVNLTQHSYFNLTGHSGSVFDHELVLNAGQYWETDSHSIPIRCEYVLNTPMDFRQQKKLGANLSPLHRMLLNTRGYDHCFMLNGNGLRPVAQVFEPESGLFLKVLTTETAMQLYTGNFLVQESAQGNDSQGRKGFAPWSGLCLETQCIPNQINMPEFSNYVTYSAAHPYRSTTVYQLFTS
ncbi:Aldose 1-epimerase [Vibrio aerogenes CECT 7868]|uniref:Aldose 1-epimerase n=1 Tax=Vibrio aerogenes CECT 7868 TaxID=1216006 RepID=A0A1M5ZW64_9VIBR|nr:aldose epimerase family protein [Vibrio aerogenes]SHI28269.1 Aldose 1-epimerase [Vibrio aerogenes CECT 7868]